MAVQKLSRLCTHIMVLSVLMTAAMTYRMAHAENLAPGSTATLDKKVYLPLASASQPTCPTTSSATFNVISFIGGPYKGNAISDENADFRLSILGFEPNNNALLEYWYYNGPADTDSPRLSSIFTPHRKPTFLKAYQVYQWNWNEGAGPPYGNRGALNTAWGGVTAIDFGTTKGESLSIPERNSAIWGSYRALVLYASPSELTLGYMLQDQVLVNQTGYVVHMLNFCVDANLVATYRAQLSASGRRSTMQLPAITNDQVVGTALGNSVTVAIRDVGAYMDPRSKKDWWYDLP